MLLYKVLAKFVFLSALLSSTKLEAHQMNSVQNNSSVVEHLRVKIAATQCPLRQLVLATNLTSA